MAKVVTLGEIMLRLATAAGNRIMNSDGFYANYGGAEANVAVSLANFDHDVSFVSKVPNNSLGMAAINHLQSYNLDVSNVLMNGNRLGVYYLETGIGRRAASVVYDRKGSSFSEMKKDEWTDEIFNNKQLFHISGITPALSDNWQELIIDLVVKARANNCKISFDMNYRSKLWTTREASVFAHKIFPLIDYCSAGKLDAISFLDISPNESKEEDLRYYYSKMKELYPNIEVFYSTKREVISSNRNLLTGTIWRNGEYCESCLYDIDNIVDRIGGGDAFSAGILHGIMLDYDLQKIVDFGTASSVMKHTVNGDCNLFTVSEVFDFMDADSSKVLR